jgi:photosystem II stability/assembly factor-like uncharacterized protein
VKAASAAADVAHLKGGSIEVATRTKRPPKRRPVQAPTRRVERKPIGRWPWAAGAAALALAIAIPTFILVSRGSSDEGATAAAAGLPDTPDYHSLLVAANNAEALTLGTHNGLYRSADGGRSWQSTTLVGQDAMNLGHATGGVTWTAGHDVLAKSTDGGRTWHDVRPEGLPHLDIHGFAVDPRDQTLWAALAGQGLYRSRDGGTSFELVTREVGGGVMALGVTSDGRVLAGDMQQGLFSSTDDGKTWKPTLPAGLMGLAVNPKQPERVVATGPGILLSTDGGRNWNQVLPIEQGAGPVAWAPSKPGVGYVVGFDKTLYRTEDAGATWQPVG